MSAGVDLDRPLRSLPLHRYADPTTFDLEVEAVFRGEWLLVCRTDEVARPGDHFAFDLLGEPLVVVRGHDGVLRCTSRLCSHRGFPLVDEGFGHLERFSCTYHLWSFRLDGSLIGAPFAAGTPCFDPSDRALPQVRLEEWQGFAFVTLDPDAGPLGPRLAGIDAALASHDLAGAVGVAVTDEVWDVNWKLGVENASESYHHTGTHATTVGPHAPPVGSWVEPGTAHWGLHRTRLTDDDAAADPDRPGAGYDRLLDLPAGELDAFRCYTIFPATVVLTWRARCTWLTFWPLATDRTRVRTGQLLPAAVVDDPGWEDARRRIEARRDVVNHEDRDALVKLQAVTGSRLASAGPLVPQEGVLDQLYRYLAARTGLPY